jgi:hypothetical protein
MEISGNEREMIKMKKIILVITFITVASGCQKKEKQGTVHTPIGSFTQEEWAKHPSNVEVK